MAQFYVHHNGHSWFVKTAAFFQEQKEAHPDWDSSGWKPIEAESIEDARNKAEAGAANA